MAVVQSHIKDKRTTSTTLPLEMTAVPVKLWHSLGTDPFVLSMDLTYSYFDVTELLRTIGAKHSPTEIRRLCKKTALSLHINTIIENIKYQTGHPFYPIKCLIRKTKVHYFCYIDLLPIVIEIAASDKKDFIVYAKDLVKLAGCVRKSTKFNSYLDRVRRWRNVLYETTLVYKGTDHDHLFDYEQFLNEYDALNQSKPLIITTNSKDEAVAHQVLSLEVQNLIKICSSELGNCDESDIETSYVQRHSFLICFPAKGMKCVSTFNVPDTTAEFKIDASVLTPEKDLIETVPTPNVEYVDFDQYIKTFAALVTMKDELMTYSAENIEFSLSIKMSEYNIAEQTSRKLLLMNEILKIEYKGNVIPTDIGIEMTLRDTEAKKLQLKSKKYLDEGKKLKERKQYIDNEILQMKRKHDSILQSEPSTKFTKLEYNNVLEEIEKIKLELVDVHIQNKQLSQRKIESIELERIAFKDKSQQKVELDRLKNPNVSGSSMMSPRRNDEVEKNIEDSLLRNHVQIRNEYIRERLNSLDEIDHLKTKALLCHRQEIVDYELSTLNVQDKLGQYTIAASMYNQGNMSANSEATIRYSESSKEREQKRKLLLASLEVLKQEEQRRKAASARRWNNFNDEKGIYGTAEEVQKEISEALKLKSEVENDLYVAQQEFRLFINREVTKARNVRNYWLVCLMAYSKHHKINPQDTMRWSYHEFRKPSKIDIPKDRDLGMGEMLKKLPDDLAIYRYDMCSILIADKPPSALKSGGNTGHKEARVTLQPMTDVFDEISGKIPHINNSMRSRASSDVSALGTIAGSDSLQDSDVEDEIKPLSPRWSKGIKIGFVLPYPIISGESRLERKEKIQAKIKMINKEIANDEENDEQTIAILKKGLVAAEEELRRCS